ncbi:MAG TPA: hypothetical protein VE010_15315 [Thermoanaerobaculia bacterium]|nr:hypothetical protein [Thermoanaerobaculia bacterium]
MTKYRFRYDARGASLEPALAQISAQTRAASPVGDKVAPAEAALAPWRQAVTVVNELRMWLDEHPDFGLDMTILEEREVLLPPPNWTYVAAEAAALARHGGRAWDVPTDAVEALMKYVDMLAARQHVVEFAAQLAAMASGASVEPTPAQRMRAALRALPQRVAIGDVTFDPLPWLLQERRIREWLELLRSRCDSLQQTALRSDWAAEERDSWQEWERRFRKYPRTGRNFQTRFRDILLRTRGAGPPVLFRNDLQRMTLREWSEAYLHSVRGKLPGPSQVPVPQWVRGEIYRVLLDRPATTLLIVGATDAPLSAQWLPSDKNGSFWVNGANVREFLQAFPEIGKAEIIVAFEVFGDAEVIARSVGADPPALNVLGSRFDGNPGTYVYMGKEKLPANVTPALPYVENPKDVDDAIAKVRALRARRSSSAK